MQSGSGLAGTIYSLPMSVTRRRALDSFRPPGPRGLLRAVRGGPLRSIAELYVPFRLYIVSIDNALRHEEKLLALDAVRGDLDLFAFPSVPTSKDLVEVSTRNHLQSRLDFESSGMIVLERVRRLVFGRGFFKIRDLRIQATRLPLDFHVPYWVGFCGWGNKANLIVMDAVRGSLEGSKLRSLITDWLCKGNSPA
jgi:hypothetical protein